MSVSAQNHPMPGAAPDPAVICTGCPGNNDSGEPNADKPTYPYDSPISLHAGRFVDSNTTGEVQNAGMRTVRAGLVRIAPTGRNRLYLALGATVGAYTLDTFFSSKLLQPMVAVNTINTGKPYGGRSPFEKLARPDRFFYAESKFAGWNTPLYDTNTVLVDFDADDRGYLYIATSRWGWGIVSDPGGADGSHLPSVIQMQDNTDMRTLMSLRSGSNYYVYHSNASNTSTLYDVTTAANPVYLGDRSGTANAVRAWSKYEAGERAALVNVDGHVRVYTYAGLIAGSAPLLDVTPSTGRQFREVSFDDDGNLWLIEAQPNSAIVTNLLWKLTPSGGGYTTTTYDVYGSVFSPTMIHASAGYIAIDGYGVNYVNELRLLRVTDGAPQLLANDDFFRKYYDKAPSGYAQPGIYASIMSGVRIVTQGTKTYLFYSAYGLGDVYELGDGPRITSMTPLNGIPAGGTNVSIYGTGFAPGATVTFDALTASSLFVSDTHMTAISPMHASGSVDVVVSVPAVATMTAPRQFTYALATPPQFVATATSTDTVALSWSGVEGATFYEVSRRSPNGTWSVIGTPSGTSFNDTSRTAETTYVYRVRATDAAANFSAYSAIDLATTMSSESSTITAGMLIRAMHLTNLRIRVNAVRAAADLTPYSFSGGAIGGKVLATNIYDLRAALNEGRTSLGLTIPTYTDSSLVGIKIKAVHLNEMLDLMR